MSGHLIENNYTTGAIRSMELDPFPNKPAGEFICNVISNDWVNDEYKLVVLGAHKKALTAVAGQFFHLLCPTPDGAEVWMRRPMSVYRVDQTGGRIEFLYKSEGRGTRGLATLKPGDDFNIAGPLGVGFWLEPDWKNIVVLGRGVGLATLAPLSQMAFEAGVNVTAILSARNRDVVMSRDLFESYNADVIELIDTDGSSDVANVKNIIEGLIKDQKVDAFFTCGSNRLLTLLKDRGQKYGIPGQVAMEQLMVCGVGACYVCVRTFNVNNERVLKRVCREGPVFKMEETVGW